MLKILCRTREAWMAVLLLAMGLFAAPAMADSIGPGWDYYATSGGHINVPNVGVISLTGGSPVGPGNTVAVVRRPLGISPLDLNNPGAIPIELVQLQLVSVQPVQIGTMFWDVSVSVDPNQASTGTMSVNHVLTNGGTFATSLNVIAKVTFTEVGNPNNSNSQILQFQVQDAAAWGHAGPPNYPGTNSTSGGFYPLDLILNSGNGNFLVNLDPATGPTVVPEPGTLALFGAGLSAMAVKLRRKLRA